MHPRRDPPPRREPPRPTQVVQPPQRARKRARCLAAVGRGRGARRRLCARARRRGGGGGGGGGGKRRRHRHGGRGVGRHRVHELETDAVLAYERAATASHVPVQRDDVDVPSNQLRRNQAALRDKRGQRCRRSSSVRVAVKVNRRRRRRCGRRRCRPCGIPITITLLPVVLDVGRVGRGRQVPCLGGCDPSTPNEAGGWDRARRGERRKEARAGGAASARQKHRGVPKPKPEVRGIRLAQTRRNNGPRPSTVTPSHAARTSPQ